MFQDNTPTVQSELDAILAPYAGHPLTEAFQQTLFHTVKDRYPTAEGFSFSDDGVPGVIHMVVTIDGNRLRATVMPTGEQPVTEPSKASRNKSNDKSDDKSSDQSNG